MFEGQFFPGQAVQFEGGVPRNPWHRRNLKQIIDTMGLASGLKLCLDAGDSASYSSGQTWLDRSGGGYDFFRGANNSSSTDDPTFNGSAGGLSSSEYFSFDGGDYFTYDSANDAWMERLHRASAKYTLMAGVYLPSGLSGSQSFLFATRGSSSTVGFSFALSTANALSIAVVNSGTVLSLTGPTAPTGQTTIVGVSVDVATSSGFWSLDGVGSSFTATYTSPSSGNAANVAKIGRRGDAVDLMPNGVRLKWLGAWEGAALSTDQMQAINVAMLLRN